MKQSRRKIPKSHREILREELEAIKNNQTRTIEPEKVLIDIKNIIKGIKARYSKKRISDLKVKLFENILAE